MSGLISMVLAFTRFKRFFFILALIENLVKSISVDKKIDSGLGENLSPLESFYNLGYFGLGKCAFEAKPNTTRLGQE